MPPSLPQDFVEVCKREGGDPEEKGVDRLLGLGSSRCAPGVLLKGGGSESARVPLLGARTCQLPRWKLVPAREALGDVLRGRVSPVSPQRLRRPSGAVPRRQGGG